MEQPQPTTAAEVPPTGVASAAGGGPATVRSTGHHQLQPRSGSGGGPLHYPYHHAPYPPSASLPSSSPPSSSLLTSAIAAASQAIHLSPGPSSTNSTPSPSSSPTAVAATSSSGSLSSSPSGGLPVGFNRSLSGSSFTPESGLTGSGEVVLGMQGLYVGAQPPQVMDRAVAEEEKEKFVVNVMQELQKRRMVMEAIEWLRANYRVGTNGFTSKRDVYNHFMRVCKNKGVEPKISHTFFGKIVKRAFPNIKYNRKGPRGATQQCYTFLQRMTSDSDAASENINVSCMQEDESMLISANPLLPRQLSDERERKEDYDSSCAFPTSSSVPISVPDSIYLSALRGGMEHASSQLHTELPRNIPHHPYPITSTVLAPQQSPISGSPSSSYVILSLPQVATPCPCSHCTNAATALTSFTIPSISSSNLTHIQSLPSITTLPPIHTLPSFLVSTSLGNPTAPASGSMGATTGPSGIVQSSTQTQDTRPSAPGSTET